MELYGRVRVKRRVHEGHGPAGTSSPRASDHAGGRLGVEVESARLDDELREVATFFSLGFCVNDCGRRLSGEVMLLKCCRVSG